MQTQLVVAVTGHRDIVPSQVASVRQAIAAFLSGLQARFPGLPVCLLSPLAEGAGRIAAQVALDLGIELTIPLPLPRHLYVTDFESAASREEFDELCRRGTVIEGSLLEGYTEEDVRSHGPARTRHYAQSGVFISGHCHILMAVWDGIELDLLGGTSQVVRYHLTDVMPGHVAEPLDSTRMLAGQENDLVYHIVCSRERSPDATSAGIEPGDAGYFTASSHPRLSAGMPSAYRRMFAQMESFNLDLASGADDGDRQPLIDRDASGDFDAAAELIDGFFASVDSLARTYQKRVYVSLRAVYTLAVLLGVSFLLYSDFQDMEYMIWLFLFFFACGVVLYLVAKRLDWHRKYLDYRALAEGLRVQFYWHVAGIVREDRTAFIHDNFLQKQDIEVAWIRNVMRFISLRTSARAGAAMPSGLNYAIAHWVGRRGPGGGGQLAYFERTAHRRTKTHLVTRALGLACMWLGIGIALVLAVAGGNLSADAQTLLVALMGGFPLIAAVREAYAHKIADKELIKQYRFMHRLFDTARERLDGAETGDERRAILYSLGTAALDEHAEWILMHRERPLEHSKL